MKDGRPQDWTRGGEVESLVPSPAAYLIEYNDGLRASVFTMDGGYGDFAGAWKYTDGAADSTLFLLQEDRPFAHFTHLLKGAEQMIHTARCERLLPGDGNIDVRGLFAALPADLPVSVEVIHLEREKNFAPDRWAANCLAASRPFLGPQD